MFKNEKLNEIAIDCGLYIDPHNMKVTYAEIEFFVEQVIKNIDSLTTMDQRNTHQVD